MKSKNRKDIKYYESRPHINNMPDARFRDYPAEVEEELKKRIYHRITKEDSGCWVWKGLDPGEYGRISVHGKKMTAHRFVYMLVNMTALEPDQYVCHSCDNSMCVNPEHLYLGDAKSNNNDRSVSHKNKGRLNPESLDMDKVLSIRAEYNKTKDAVKVGRVFNMAAADVKLVVGYENYPWLT